MPLYPHMFNGGKDKQGYRGAVGRRRRRKRGRGGGGGGGGEGGWSPENDSLAAMIVLQPQGQPCTSSQRLSKENAVHST